MGLLRKDRPLLHRYFDETSPQLDHFGWLLALTVATVAAMSLIDVRDTTDRALPAIQSTMLGLVVGVTLLLALRAAGVARRFRVGADVFIALASVVSVVLLIVELTTDADLSAWQSDRQSPIWLVVSVLTPFAVIRRLVRHRTVSRQTLEGAIAAYLLIALAFSSIFLAIDSVQNAAFFAEGAGQPTTSFMYFSLVTIATVGYGDLSPATEVGRLFASFEAVVGQVYLVTIVAMVVGLMIQQRHTD